MAIDHAHILFTIFAAFALFARLAGSVTHVHEPGDPQSVELNNPPLPLAPASLALRAFIQIVPVENGSVAIAAV
jgi:hypothetical protein